MLLALRRGRLATGLPWENLPAPLEQPESSESVDVDDENDEDDDDDESEHGG